MSYFQQLFSGQYPAFAAPFPECGLIFDTETNGTDVHLSYILQFGLCTVFNNEIVDRISFLLKPVPGMVIPADATRVHGITIEKCEKYGIPRDDAFSVAFELFNTYLSSGCALIGHNVYAFDIALLRQEAMRRGVQLNIPDTLVWDTGMLIKAYGMGLLPFFNRSRGAFYYDVSNSYSRAKWNLAYCSDLFGLTDSVNNSGLDYHDALFDCLKSFQVLQHIRLLATGVPNAIHTAEAVSSEHRPQVNA